MHEPNENNVDFDFEDNDFDDVFVMDLHKTARYKELTACKSFYDGTQHDHQSAHWDGTPRNTGIHYLNERIESHGFVPTSEIPNNNRKPDTAFPLGRQIVNRFTAMLLGEGRQPKIVVPSDLETERYLRAVFNASQMWDVLAEARDVAGACGACAIVCVVENGNPTAEVLDPCDCVAIWDDTVSGWVPKDLIEQRMITKVSYEEGKFQRKQYYRTRRWTENATIYYKDVPSDWDKEDPIPIRDTVEHGLGMCPVTWHQNTRNTKSPEGQPDCAAAFHLLDQLDRQASQVSKAVIANTDPTLYMKDEATSRFAREGVIRKGHRGVIRTTPVGDAKFLEINGDSIKIAMDYLDHIRQEILHTTECVIVEPVSTGPYKSGETIQLLWRSMEARANRLRVPIMQTVRRICDLWIKLGATFGVSRSDKEERSGVVLPPYVAAQDTAEPPDQDNENNAVLRSHSVGDGRFVDIQWPPYWDPTAQQVQFMATAMRIAEGSLSKESRIRHLATYLGIDPAEEFVRLLREEEQEREEARMEFMEGMQDMEEEDAPPQGDFDVSDYVPENPGKIQLDKRIPVDDEEDR